MEPPTEMSEGHLVDPPIVDSLIGDDSRREWSVIFIPEDSVSSREKEQVVIPFDSADGHRVQLRMQRLKELLDMDIERVFHVGDGDYSFHARSGKVIALADPHGRIDLSMKAYVELADIAMTAQIAFLAVAPTAH
ncbi:MAG TPA: hypothetical protein VIM11_15755 [Tepidisphaeraceae bacterium]|jgi:hypothetical protein